MRCVNKQTRSESAERVSSVNRKTVHRTVFTAAYAAAALSSPRYKNNPNPSPTEIRFGLLTLGTPEGTRHIMVSASSSRRRANVHRTFTFYGSSPRYRNNPNPSPTEIRFGLFFFGTPEGTRNIMVSPPSSRRQANVHRTFAFYGSSPRYKNNPNPSPTEIRFGLLTLGTPEGTRTPNPRNRNPMLYPLSHRRIS